MADEELTAAEEPTPPPTVKQRADTLYGVVVGVLYVVAVGIQVFMVVDEVTDGQLSTDMVALWRRLTARYRHHQAFEAMVKADFPYVLWSAHEILDVEGRET